MAEFPIHTRTRSGDPVVIRGLYCGNYAGTFGRRSKIHFWNLQGEILTDSLGPSKSGRRLLRNLVKPDG